MSELLFKSTQSGAKLSPGKVKWSSPSNIALVKYWGKSGVQIPANASISFTLSNCKTVTSVSYRASDGFDFEIYVDDKISPDFKPKITQFFERIATYCPFVNDLHLEIKTTNTFPHSSGIASSASGMSALALCICDIEKQLNPEMIHHSITKGI